MFVPVRKSQVQKQTDKLPSPLDTKTDADVGTSAISTDLDGKDNVKGEKRWQKKCQSFSLIAPRAVTSCKLFDIVVWRETIMMIIQPEKSDSFGNCRCLGVNFVLVSAIPRSS